MESIGQFMGEIAEGFDAEKLRDAIDRLPGILDDGEVIASGKNRIVAISAGSRQFVVKRFGLEPGWKDRIDESRGSAALRSWIAARHLLAHGVGTPEPVAVLEKRDSGRLVDSYYIT